MIRLKNLSKILTVVLLFGLYSCSFKNEKQEYADMIIEKVETFRKENNRLPRDVSELGLVERMDGPAYYQLQTDSTYLVWYGLGLGESKIYRSATNKWTIEG